MVASGVSIQGQMVTKHQSVVIDSLCKETFEEGNFPGMVVMVALGDSIIWSDGYGYANIEKKKEANPYSSLFRIGSVSKTVTSAALAILLEEGKVNLDEEVQAYVPYFPKKKYPVTVRQISGHIGGIRHYAGMEFMSNIEYKDVATGIDIFKNSELLFEPGSKYSYSSYGWNLVSAVIEGSSQVPFLKYMQEKVFIPFGMDNIYAESETLQLENKVDFYMHDAKGEIIPTYKVNNSYKWAGGGFIATAVDLVKFSSGIQENKIFSSRTRKQLWKSCTLNDGSKTNYGLGWATNVDDEGRKWVGHSGGSVGGTSMYLLYPEEELTVITLVNLSGARMERLAWKIASEILDQQ